jgi:hypothetical protein
VAISDRMALGFRFHLADGQVRARRLTLVVLVQRPSRARVGGNSLKRDLDGPRCLSEAIRG